ncbi:hypothetical protein [Synechococcus sp. MIT S1220]|uniref:hypothetical protein n=1 Tax=Synechococcus sp. MIT S1220 TaxID=3082549 RepID=UPI0039B05E27
MREAAKQEIRRIERSSTDTAIRRALSRVDLKTYRSTEEQPLIEWRPSDEAEFWAWHRKPAPPTRRWDEATGFEMWEPGQEFLLLTEGELLSMFVPINGCSVRPRWLGFTPGSGRLRLDQLTTRNPREVWHDPWLLQLANALVKADRGDPAYAWLKPGLDPAKPKNLGLIGVLCDALSELR